MKQALLALAALAGCASAPKPPPGPPAELTTRELRAGNVEVSLFAEVRSGQGFGKPLVALPGGPGLSHQYLEPLLRLATPARAVVLLDLRGTGASSTPTAKSWPRAAYVRDIEVLRAALGVEQMHLLGHSWGGRIAIAYAAAYPKHVASLSLVGSVPPLEIATKRMIEESGPRVRKLIAEGLIPAEPPGVGANGDCLPLMLAFAPMWHANPRRKTNLGATTCRNVFAQIQKGAVNTDQGEDLASLRSRTLVLQGEADPIGLNAVQVLAGALTGAPHELVTIPDCGHLPWDECPAPFFAALERFLDAPPPGPTPDVPFTPLIPSR